MGFKGIDLRQSGDRIVFRALLKDAAQDVLTTGTTTLRLYELQSDGTLKSYDFSSHTFKTTALTTETAAMTNRAGNNGTTPTGIWTYALTTVAGFTRGNIYIATVTNAGAIPETQEREFQFGEGEGDLAVDSNGAPSDSSGITSLLARITSARAGYLDNLNIGGNVAGSAEVTAIQNNTRVVRIVPEVIERPDAGTTTYRAEIFLYDSTGNMEAPDSAPTIALVNQAGTDRSSRLDSTTMSLVETGRYRAVYTADAADAIEQLVWTFSVTEGGATRKYGNQSLVIDTTAVDFTSSDRTKLDAVYAKLPSKTYLTGTANSDGDVQLDEATGNSAGVTTLLARVPGTVQPQTGDAYARLGAPNGASISADLAAAKADTAAILDDTGTTGVVVAAGSKTGYSLANVDGLTFSQIVRAILAAFAGKAAVTDNGDGTSTIVYKQQDGSTAALTVTYNRTTGAPRRNRDDCLMFPSNYFGPQTDPADPDAIAAAVAEAVRDAVSITITPLQTTTTNPRYATRDLAPIAQLSEPTDIWAVVDAAGEPVPLAGKTIRLVVASIEDAGVTGNPFDDTFTAPAFQYETGGDGITIGGDDDNQITVQHDADKTATPGDYRYWLLNLTDRLVLAKGKLPIHPLPDDAWE